MIFFDLDDTLINTHKRHYEVILAFLKKEGVNKFIPYIDYLDVRKKRELSNKLIIDKYFPSEKFDVDFQKFFIDKIEHPDFLKYDELIVDIELLKKNSNHRLGICSLRSNRDNAINELKTMDLFDLFDEIVFLKHRKKNPKTDYFSDRADINIFIGDSKTDFEATFETNINFFGVKTGFYDLKCPIISENVNDILIKDLIK